MTKTYRVRTDTKFAGTSRRVESFIWQRTPLTDAERGKSKRENPITIFTSREAAQAKADAAMESGKLAWGENSPYRYIVVEGKGDGFPVLTADQRKAMIAFVISAGRYWKRDLRFAWEAGRVGPELQQLRNTHGPRWLKNFILD